MNVDVQLFAVVRQWAGADSIQLDVPAGATVATLREKLLAKVPQLAAFGTQLRFAVNADYADDNTQIPAAAVVACIPPVSGG
jgi:sulfur-carrier protein